MGTDAGETKKPSASIGDFAELIAEGTPAPGGGSIAAYCGLLATSLGRMMCNLTIGKAKYAAVEPKVRELTLQLERLGDEFKDLIDEDAASFDSVLAAYRLPKDTEERKAERDEKIQAALRHAIETPYHTAGLAVDVLKILADLASIGNPNVLPDISSGAQLARTAVKGAYYNIAVNLSGLSDAAAADNERLKIQVLIDNADRLADQVEQALMKNAG